MRFPAVILADLNLAAMQSFNNILSFIEQNNNEEDHPDLGEGYVVSDIGATYKAPEVYITPDNPNIARYEGQFYIEYLEQRKEG